MPESQELPEKKTGRPSDYSDALADAICERIADGESLRSICRDEEMPGKSTVMRWLADDKYGAFRDQYASAHVEQAETLREQILEIADGTAHDTIVTDFGPKPNAEWINRSKLMVDARFKLMALLNPKKYGPKVAVDHTTGGEPFKAYAGFDPAQV